MKTSLDNFENAIKSLSIALAEPLTDIVRDATIQRFKFCVELSWKTSKKAMATSSHGPKVIIREMAQQGLIKDAVKWLGYIEARNLSSHTYKEEIAKQVYKAAQEFLEDGQALLEALKKL